MYNLQSIQTHKKEHRLLLGNVKMDIGLLITVMSLLFSLSLVVTGGFQSSDVMCISLKSKL